MKRLVLFAFFLLSIFEGLCAQSKFHIDVDYHYNLGISEKFVSRRYSRTAYKMGGNSLRFTTRYDVSTVLSTGIGAGLDRYTEVDFNTMPIYATIRYSPIRKVHDVYLFSIVESMTDIYCQAANVPNTDIAAFDNSPIENMTLYVPGESIEAYKTTDPWSGFGKFQALTTGIEKTETTAKPMITTADGQIAVSGLSGNATIQVLSLDGKLLDSISTTDGIATLNVQPGKVVIVKVGTESYKVVVK